MTLSWARSSSTLFTLLLLMKSARSLMLLRWKESQQWDQRFKFGFQVSMVVSAVVQGRIAGFQMLHCFGWWIWSLNAGVRVWPSFGWTRIKLIIKLLLTIPKAALFTYTGLIDRNVVEEWIVNPTTEQLRDLWSLRIAGAWPMAWLHWLSSKEAFSLRLSWISGQCNIHHRLANL